MRRAGSTVPRPRATGQSPPPSPWSSSEHSCGQYRSAKVGACPIATGRATPTVLLPLTDVLSSAAAMTRPRSPSTQRDPGDPIGAGRRGPRQPHLGSAPVVVVLAGGLIRRSNAEPIGVADTRIALLATLVTPPSPPWPRVKEPETCSWFTFPWRSHHRRGERPVQRQPDDTDAADQLTLNQAR